MIVSHCRSCVAELCRTSCRRGFCRQNAIRNHKNDILFIFFRVLFVVPYKWLVESKAKTMSKLFVVPAAMLLRSELVEEL